MTSHVLIVATLLASSAVGGSASADAAAPIVEHGPRDSKKIALTFDACRTALSDEYDGPVIDVLVREKVPATIFMSGKWAERNPDKAFFLASQAQFEMANHAYWHPHLRAKGDRQVLADLRQTQGVLKKLTGKQPVYFRPPYGEVDGRVARLAAQAGLVTIQYDIASGDSDPKLKPDRIVRSILRNARGGSIIVFHMNRHGVHTAEMLPAIVAGLRKKGFELVTVGEMLKDIDAEDLAGEDDETEEVEIAFRGRTSVTTEEY